MEKVYTLQEVAKMSKLHLNTIYRHLKTGKLKANRIGGYWRVSESDLKLYLFGKTEKEGN